MREVFERYLHTFLGNTLLDYPRERVASAWDVFVRCLPVIGRDVLAKHYRLGDEAAALEDLFGLMMRDQTIEAVVLYRLEHALFRDDPDDPLLECLPSLMRIRSGIELYYSTSVGPGFSIQHGAGSVLGPRNRIGRNFRMYQCVTIGQQHNMAPGECAVIGDDVTLFAGAKILGSVTIGDNVVVGANAVVLGDLESNAVYAGVPAKKIGDLEPKE